MVRFQENKYPSSSTEGSLSNMTVRVQSPESDIPLTLATEGVGSRLDVFNHSFPL
jgi:hypothetical protein